MGKAFSKEDIYAKILFLGLDNSGKTSLLYHRKYDKNINSVSTEGQNVEILRKTEGISFVVWDMAGCKSSRGRWEEHYADADGIIFVLDSSNQGRFHEVKDELHKLIANEDLHGVPICVLAHKQDVESSDTPNDIVDLIELREVTSHEWRIFGTSVVSGTGIDDAFSEFALLVRRSFR